MLALPALNIAVFVMIVIVSNSATKAELDFPANSPELYAKIRESSRLNSDTLVHTVQTMLIHFRPLFNRGQTKHYEVDREIQGRQRRLIQHTLTTISTLLPCVKFVNSAHQPIRLVFEASSRANNCKSDIGFIGRSQRIELGRNCYTRNTILRLILNSLGLLNEVHRMDRDTYVKIIEKNMSWTEILEGDGPKLEEIDVRPAPNQFNVSDFQYDDSIMHYSARAAGKIGKDGRRMRTIRRLDGQRLLGRKSGTMSKVDVNRLGQFYGCF